MMIVTEEHQAKVKAYFKEATGSTERIKEAQAELKDILDVLKADHDIPPAVARKVIGAMIKGNAPEIKEANETFDDLYEIAG